MYYIDDEFIMFPFLMIVLTPPSVRIGLVVISMIPNTAKIVSAKLLKLMDVQQ